MPNRWFVVGCGVETALGVVALLLARWLDLSLAGHWRWEAEAMLWGALAVLPLLGLLGWTLVSRLAWVRSIREFLDATARPLFACWSVWQIALISAAAGVGEELLFRGVAQPWASTWLGEWAGLLLVSAIFGAFHSVTTGYAVVAAVMGLYLGWLTNHFGNLLVPMVAHALYDFLALIYWLRIRPTTAARSAFGVR